MFELVDEVDHIFTHWRAVYSVHKPAILEPCILRLQGKRGLSIFFYTSKQREWLLLNQRESSVNMLCYLCRLPSEKQGLPLLLYTESIIFLEV